MNGPDGDDERQRLEKQFREMLQKANMTFAANDRGQSDETSGQEQESGVKRQERLQRVREFDLKPRDIRDYLDRFVVRQDEAKKVLSVAICDHYNHVRRCLEQPALEAEEHAKHNIVLLGPTGVGKTYLMRCIARLIGVPFVKADATKFTETGYVGHDVEDLVRDLVKAADNDVDLAQYGIIFVDEIDKIAAQSGAGGKDVSGRGVQINLLKLMEDTDVSLFSQTDLIGQMQAVMDMQRGRDAGKRVVNTRHILFIVSGAFEKLADQVRQRVSRTTIGFAGGERRVDEACEYLRRAETRDFIDYGFEPEFVGRLPIRVVCDALDVDDLRRIMESSEGNILSQYEADFEGYGIGFKMTPEAVAAVAALAHREKTGARGLMTVLERTFRNFKFELPSTAITSFEADEKCVRDPGGSLVELLKRKESARRERLGRQVKEFADGFEAEHGLKVVFEREAVDAVVEMCITGDKEADAFCTEHFRDLEYGLKLIARNTGNKSFTVTRRFAENPGEALSKRIAASFKRGE